MGGNAKHMPHVWEHYDATFDQVLGLLESLAVGSIDATEKFDGCNIHFRVDNKGTVRFSRNKKDISSGGFTFAEALELYQNHDAKDTFVGGCRAIDEAYTDKWWPFGYSGRDWINAEIVYSPREQLLKYDENAIVLHQVVTYSPNLDKKFFDPVKQAKILNFALNERIELVTLEEWKIVGPQQVTLLNDSGQGYLTDAKARLEKCMLAAGLSKENSLRDFLRYSLLAGPLSQIKTSASIREKLADKISGVNPNVRLVDLKRNQPSGVASAISFYGQVKNMPKHQRAALKPVINTIDAFSSARLACLQSSLIENANSEKNRLMLEITNDASRIEMTKDTDSFYEERKKMFNDFLSEWRSVEDEPSAIEGITFDFCGKRTKITGGFASLNQLLGVCRYGRGGVPPLDMSNPTPKSSSTPSLVEWFGLI